MRRHLPHPRPRSRLRLALIVAGLAIAFAPGQLTPQTIDTLAIREDTRVLAHDSMEGRGTGTPGEARAARYIVDRLRGMGIPGAAPDGGYLQPVPLHEVSLGAESRIVIEDRDGESPATFLPGQDFILAPATLRAYRDFSGMAVFAGTAGLAGRALEDAGPLDDRVIVILGTLGRTALDLIPDWKARGAAGVILLIPDEGGFTSVSSAYGPSHLALDAPVENPVWQPDLPVLIAGPRVATALLAGAPLPPGALDGSIPFSALPLERRVEAAIEIETRALESSNIAARIEGSEPTLANEFVVYTAHYDHLGIGAPDALGDSVYNGFSDNAAGTAMLLAIAGALRDDPPARSVLFLFFTGEERGLLGSSYHVVDPLVPLDEIAAVINLDAGAPSAPPLDWRLAGGTQTALGSRAKEVIERQGWEAELRDASPNSDHWPFLHKGVPAIFIIPGQRWEGVTRAEKEELQHRWERYHQQGDEWHPDFPFAGLQRYAEVALLVGLEIANNTRPEEER